MNWIGVNGKVLPADEAVISVMDHGFMYGLGLFETFRTYDGIPSLLSWHLERLCQGCETLGIQYEPDTPRLRSHIADLLGAAGLSEAYIRYTVTAGEEGLGLPSGDYASPQEVVYVKALPEMPDTLYRQGRALRLLHTPRNTPEGTVRLKSLHYMNNILAKRELNSRQKPGDEPAEGLLLTAEGYLSEGIVSNLFFVNQDVLYTPSIDTGILPGITRRCILELAGAMGIACKEGLYTWEELQQADEIFISNSIQELVPVTSLWDREDNRIRIGTGSCGKHTEWLLQAYREKVGDFA